MENKNYEYLKNNQVYKYKPEDTDKVGAKVFNLVTKMTVVDCHNPILVAEKLVNHAVGLLAGAMSLANYSRQMADSVVDKLFKDAYEAQLGNYGLTKDEEGHDEWIRELDAALGELVAALIQERKKK